MRLSTTALFFTLVACGAPTHRFNSVASHDGDLWVAGYTVETERSWLLRCDTEGSGAVECREVPVDAAWASDSVGIFGIDTAPRRSRAEQRLDTTRGDRRPATELAEFCEHGDAHACNALGERFASGDGVRESPEIACELFTRSCDLENADACANLAFFCDESDLPR